jgi:hypothetical protein
VATAIARLFAMTLHLAAGHKTASLRSGTTLVRGAGRVSIVADSAAARGNAYVWTNPLLAALSALGKRSLT